MEIIGNIEASRLTINLNQPLTIGNFVKAKSYAPPVELGPQAPPLFSIIVTKGLLFKFGMIAKLDL